MATFSKLDENSINVLDREGMLLAQIYFGSSEPELFFEVDTDSVVGLTAEELGQIVEKMNEGSHDG